MKNLRGRPRNISDSGIVYLDSDGDDSEYSDSDVEPVFFPAAELEFGDALEDFAAGGAIGGDDDDDEVNGNDANERHRFFQLINALDTDDTSSEEEEITAEVPPGVDPDLHNRVYQFFGGTVQVRHVVNENFAQFVQQQQSQNNSSNVVVEEPSHSGQSVQVGEGNIEDDVILLSPIGNENTAEQVVSSPGEPPSICESEITIFNLDQEEGDSAENPGNSSMTDHSNELLRNPGRIEGSTPEEGTLQVQAVVESGSATEETLANTSSGSSGLVPYPDLPDYASCGEEDDEDDYLKASIPAPYKSPTDSYTGKSPSTSSRPSLKRKEPEKEEGDDDIDENGDNERKNVHKASRKRIGESNDKFGGGDAPEEDEEVTCNPMVSDEECSETEEAFRGDRIGSTTYSERHVLKILMKWLEEIPRYSIENLLKAREKEENDEEAEKKVLRLDTELEEQMSLLWDMSSETDVMSFLVENKVFSIISDTIDRSACNRLTEIALGILANVISEPCIIEDFTVHDSSIQLVEKVVDLCNKVSDVAVLIQVFSVLRRIVWYLKNMAPVKKWMDLLQSSSFLGCSNFIMSSSRNALLLGNVIMLFFTLLDCLNPENDDDTESVEGDVGENENNKEEEDPNNPSSKSSLASKRDKLAKNYEPFCESEFIPSICEALKELMKNPKPRAIHQRKLTSTRDKAGGEQGPSNAAGGQTDEHCPTADDIDIPIPEGHVQQAILKGFSTLALLQKTSNGLDSLKRNAKQIVIILMDFYRIFVVCTEAVTRSVSLEYFALSLHLLSFCHTSLESVSPEAVTTPISTASKLVSLEEKDKETDMVIRVQLKDGVEFDSVSYIALVAHEYLASVAEKFGTDATLETRNNTTNEKFFALLDGVLAKFSEKSDKQKSDTEIQNNTLTA